MPKRTRYHVVPDGDDWKVEKEGASRASARCDTKHDAVDRGRDLAKGQGPSQLIIHKKDGVIQEERTYGGKDPFPPKG